MPKLRVGILDLVTKAPTKTLWARVVHPSFASIMPQALAVWCEQAGHEVTFVCYTGFEDLMTELPDDLDVLFVGAFSQAGQLSYALSRMFQRRGLRDRPGRSARALLSGGRLQVLRLRPGLHGQGHRWTGSSGSAPHIGRTGSTSARAGSPTISRGCANGGSTSTRPS